MPQRLTTLKPRRVLSGLALAGVLFASTSAATAMQDDLARQRPPVPSATAEPPIITTFLVLAVLVAVGVGAQALPSKRGHQD